VSFLDNIFRSFIEQAPLSSLPDIDVHSSAPSQFGTDSVSFSHPSGNNAIPERANQQEDLNIVMELSNHAGSSGTPS